MSLYTATYPQDFYLESESLRLHPPCETDAPALFPFMSDHTLTEFLAWEPHKELVETEILIKNLKSSQLRGESFHWAICWNNNPCGIVSVIDVKRNHRCWRIDRGELAYWVGPAFQGKGIATEASRLVVTFSFEKLKLNKLLLMHVPSNTRSSAIPKKLGFRQVGIYREAFNKSGKWYDMVLHELLASNWTRQQSSS